MPEGLFISLVASIFLGIVAGWYNFSTLNLSLRFVFGLVVITLVNEVICFFIAKHGLHNLKYNLYHVFNVFQAILLSLFFLHSFQPSLSRKYWFSVIAFWGSVGLLNGYFLQPFDSLNSNMLLLESLSFITLSLFYIYLSLKRDATGNLFHNTHFLLSIAILTLWSSCIFFWAFISILFKYHWQYIRLMLFSQVAINIVVYTSIAVIFFYNKKSKLENL